VLADGLTPADLVPLLRGRFGRPYRFVPSCTSTQRLLLPDDVEGTVVAADVQTEGRGRLGRRWEAPPGTAVLCSILLVPPIRPARLPELSPIAGHAVAAAIFDVAALEPEVELPNDVLLDGRKVAGILAEASEGRVVLGIGVNVDQTQDQLPGDARRPPTSLRVASGRRHPRAPLLAAILLRLEERYDAWVASGRAEEG
jgi:BirA family biotin operon repressor/biotin-[acetyl-CoA-carboxylase] ligase